MKTFSSYFLIINLLSLLSLAACSGRGGKQTAASLPEDSLVRFPGEKHFEWVRQLTSGGENAEAYWSFDDRYLVFQATNEEWNASCDQIFFMNPWESRGNTSPIMLSTGFGRTTCAYFLPGDTLVLYASTHESGSACPENPPRMVNGRYVWPIYPGYDIYTADLQGKITGKLTDTPGYDAEATVSPLGDKIVFTSLRSGDLELYTMNIDGTDIRQITSEPGYDGGAFFSPDGSMLVFRASRPKSEEALNEYRDLLSQGLVMPTEMEVYVCNADGSNLRQVTRLGGANWSPFFHPSGEKIIFSSNHESESGFPFNLYMVNIDGTGLERITHDTEFDAFPMFSNDGRYLVFASNRNNGGTRETNLFLARWKEMGE